jgi:hypothetical protein
MKRKYHAKTAKKTQRSRAFGPLSEENPLRALRENNLERPLREKNSHRLFWFVPGLFRKK